MKTLKVVLSLGMLGLLSIGCVSKPLKFPTVQEVSQRPYDVVGEGRGEATGIMLFGCIPIGQNERFVNAYNAAVQSQNGDALINPTIEENWFWGYVLNGYQTRVFGTVIKYKQP